MGRLNGHSDRGICQLTAAKQRVFDVKRTGDESKKNRSEISPGAV
jgi:hypothetical protein